MKKYKTNNIGYKICHRCLKELPTIENFNKDKNGADGYQRYCKECWKGIRVEGNKGREMANLYSKTYSVKHRVNIKKANFEYKQTAKGRIYEARCNAKRRDLTKKVDSTLTIEQWENCKKYFTDKNDNLHCAYCDKILLRADKEHFIPLSKGGEFTINNVLPICKHCNSSKRDRDFLPWFKSKEFYSKKRERKIYKYLHYNSQYQQLTIV